MQHIISCTFRNTYYSIASTIINLIISLVFVVVLKTGIIGLVYSQLASAAIVTSIMTWRLACSNGVSINWPTAWASVKLSLPLTLRVFIGIINNQFDKYMLGLLSTLSGVGVYGVGQRVSQAVFTGLNALQNVYSPKLYKLMFDNRETGHRSIGQYLTPFAYISLALALLLSLFAEEAVFFLLGESFKGAADIITLLSLFWGFIFFRKIFGYQLIFMKKTFLSSIIMIIGISFNIVLNIPFILKWGALGAAWGTMLAGLLTGLTSFYFAQHCYQIIWEYKKIGISLAFLFFTGIAVIILRDFQITYLYRLTFKLFSTVVYIWLGFYFEILSWENIRIVKKVVSFRRVSV